MKRVARIFLLLVVLNCFSSEKRKTVFLTGAAGFIGSNFLEYMFNKYENYNFIVLDSLTYAGRFDNFSDEIKKSPRFNFVYGSVCNEHLVENLMSKSHFVVHFAAESHVQNSIYEDKLFFETDVMGTRSMMRALVRHKDQVERFIHISTSEVYGTALFEPMDEQHLLNPQSPYAAAKAGADRLVYSYWCTYDVPALIIRPFNNYGPRQHIEKVIPLFITNVLSGGVIPIHGLGIQTRDWIHVDDTCKALDLALHIKNFENIKHKAINIGSGLKTSVLDIAAMIINHLGMSKDKIVFGEDRPGQVNCHIADNSLAKLLLGWEQTIFLEEGIKSTLDWYMKNITWWQDTVVITPYIHD